MRVTLIHNQGAGEGQHSKEELIDALREQGFDPTYQSSDDKNWERALDDPGKLLIVAGGDGTVARVCKRHAERGMGKATPIAVVPLGTANNIASSIRAGGPLRKQIAHWKTPGATKLPFDVGHVLLPDGTNKLFIESVGCGLFAEMMVRFDRKQKAQSAEVSPEEAIRLAREEMRKMLRESRVRQVKVEIDGQDCSGQYLLVEAMNIPRVGPGFEIAPESTLGDGMLDVVFVHDSPDDRARLDAHLREHPVDEPAPPLLSTRQAHEVIIDSGDHQLHLDDRPWPGEGQQPGGPVKLSVEKRALTFLVP